MVRLMDLCGLDSASDKQFGCSDLTPLSKPCLSCMLKMGVCPPPCHKEVDLSGSFSGSDWCFEWSSPSLCPL